MIVNVPDVESYHVDDGKFYGACLTIDGTDWDALRHELRDKIVLITGATGSWGRTAINILLEHVRPAEIRVFSRDELKQSVMQDTYSAEMLRKSGTELNYVIGDIRNLSRVEEAMEGVYVVFHAAALKQVVAMEKNPMEAVQTNILGSANIVRAAKNAGVTKLVALSSDKAASPCNLYGATKLCQDKIVIQANSARLSTAVVRYGNVWGSRGSVVPFFLKRLVQGQSLPITHESMTRFSLSLTSGVCFVLHAILRMRGGEIYVPKLPSYRITDIARVLAQKAPSGQQVNIIKAGIRPGEKMHECMIPIDEAMNTIEYRDHYVILPKDVSNPDHYLQIGGKKVSDDFIYESGSNSLWLSDKYLEQACFP